MVLLLLLVLAALPLAGVAWIAIYGSLLPRPTIDALFMSLILLAMSGILGATALFELRHRMLGASAASGGSGSRSPGHTAPASGPVRRGTVKEVVFYEAHVGQPNKSIVTLSDGGGTSELLVLSGDVRNALPVGQRVQVTVRKEAGLSILAHVQYS
jgi:hypothetical protein